MKSEGSPDLLSMKAIDLGRFFPFLTQVHPGIKMRRTTVSSEMVPSLTIGIEPYVARLCLLCNDQLHRLEWNPTSENRHPASLQRDRRFSHTQRLDWKKLKVAVLFHLPTKRLRFRLQKMGRWRVQA